MKTEEKVLQVAIEDIIPNRFQPRLAFDEEGLKELSESIKEHGIIQPLVLRRLGDKFEIIAGERRYKAATMAGLRKVPAIISDLNDNESAEVALVENIQRRNLTPIEEAKSYKSLLDRGYLTQESLAEKMGVSQSSIANKLRLLNLAPEVQDALLEEKISERHARSLLALPKEEQGAWLKKIISKRMTVRQLDMAIKSEKGEESTPLENVSEQTNLNEVISVNNNIEVNNEVQNNIEATNVNPEPVSATNKFFNFLEENPTDMSMNNPFGANTVESVNTNDIDVLDSDDEITPVANNIQEVATPNVIQEAPITNISPNNSILEVKNETPVFNPMDTVNILDPNYLNNLKQQNHLDLGSAINEVRAFVDSMNQKGFNVKLDEIPLDGSYQMTLNISENK